VVHSAALTAQPPSRRRAVLCGAALPLRLLVSRRSVPAGRDSRRGAPAGISRDRAHRSQRPLRLARLRARRPAARHPGDHRRRGHVVGRQRSSFCSPKRRRGTRTSAGLITETHLGAERLDPRLPLSAIEARHEGLIILSGSRRDGLLPRTLETEGLSAARKLAEQCRRFGRTGFLSRSRAIAFAVTWR
jgi:hypothetical protein